MGALQSSYVSYFFPISIFSQNERIITEPSPDFTPVIVIWAAFTVPPIVATWNYLKEKLLDIPLNLPQLELNNLCSSRHQIKDFYGSKIVRMEEF